MDRDHELLELARQARNHLHYQASLGVENLPRVETAIQTPSAAAEPQPSPATHAVASQAPSYRQNETLADIERDLGDCTRCFLAAGRNRIVFGQGNPQAELMFVGEGPGRDEDRQGVPFVGRAGELLTDIIVKGMQMQREDCYIANIVKCRPPNNRDPQPDEALTCLPFLRRQIAVIQPKVVVALGRVAAQYLLDTTEAMVRLRNRFHDMNGIAVMPTYHPSFLLRKPEMKRETWEDIKLVIARLSQNSE